MFNPLYHQTDSKSLGLVKVQANTSCKQFKLIEIAHWLTSE